MRAILTSKRANLIPMQLRGPQLKGKWERWGRLAFSSGVNLHVCVCVRQVKLSQEQVKHCVSADCILYI